MTTTMLSSMCRDTRLDSRTASNTSQDQETSQGSSPKEGRVCLELIKPTSTTWANAAIPEIQPKLPG